MTYLSLRSTKGSSCVGVLALTSALLGGPARAAPCPASTPALERLVEAEYAFARAARVSVRQAFLDHLADDALVLQPDPVPGRAWYASHPDGPGSLQWYPHVAAVAASGDVGFTSGPYLYAREGAQAFGQFLTVWRLSADCRWQVAFDGGISHGKLPEVPAVDPSAVAPATAPTRPPEDVQRGFQSVAGREGLGAALRTYGRNEGFLLLLDGQPPMALGPAERQLRTRIVKEPWREVVRGASADGTLTYVVGSLGRGAYTQIWQYDGRTGNLALRVLLLTRP